MTLLPTYIRHIDTVPILAPKGACILAPTLPGVRDGQCRCGRIKAVGIGYHAHCGGCGEIAVVALRPIEVEVRPRQRPRDRGARERREGGK